MLSNRELAIFIWLVIVSLILLVIMRKNLFSPLIDIVKAVWNLFCMPFSIIVNLYVALIFSVLWFYNVLETDLLITFSLWIFLFLYPSINIIYSKHCTLSIDDFVKSTLSLNIIFLFVVNQYTFPLKFELLLVPILFLLGAVSELTKNKIDFDMLNKISNSLILWLGIFMIFNAVIHFFLNLDDWATLLFWKSFAIELYVLLHLPLLYFVKYYGYYEKFNNYFTFKTYYRLSGVKKHLFISKVMFQSKFKQDTLNTFWDNIKRSNFRSKEEMLRSVKHEQKS
ncbi:hypothetical protein CSV79_15755 [Sporosarcina sp. P13]|uniref:hypothetical protein n=1 Tax=Sporosarcina sp. P13 TaxID=2048263 RepID=UPI000C17351F|nr:hypothetical protein [Sporosarcina sp. P13]PIC62701.1 hypothetical protein CSV79_15755 [Sporosarcina sp. P13]